jgi:hypothetical protein
MSTGFRYSDVAQSTGGLKVLIPEQYRNDQVNSVQLIDGKGNVLENGNYARFADNRENYHFDKKGYEYPADTQVRLTLKNGQTQLFNPKDGLKPGEPGPGNPNSTYQGIEGPNSAAYRAGNTTGSIATSPGGNPYVVPGGFDFSQLPIPSVDFNSAFDFASNLAHQNRDTYYNEITGPDARNAALGLVDTDIAGINKGLDALIPRIRAEGNADTATNIGRAGMIDQFNESRIPGMNSFNRNEVSQNNEFNQEQRAEAVDSSGIDYRGRIGDILDQLQTQSHGQLSGDMENELDRSLGNRGSELGMSSGVSPVSGAGVRANDRLTIAERLAIQSDAQHTLPNVLTQAQQILQSPEERAPTLFAQPTQVPLNPSNVAEKIPVTSNISAGATQLHIGEKATEIGTIDATHALDQNLATQQFNASAGFNAGLAVGDRTQGQIMAQDNATQNALNQDKADQIRGQQYQEFQDGLSTQILSDGIKAGGLALGGITGAAASSPRSGGLGGVISSVGGGIADAINWGAQQIGYQDNTAIGGRSATGNMFHDFLGGNNAPIAAGASEAPPAAEGISDQTMASAGGFTDSGSDTSSSGSGSSGDSNVFEKAIKAGGNVLDDAKTLSQGASTISNWSQFSPVQQIAAAGTLAAGAAKNTGIVSEEDANHISNISNALSVIANPAASTLQKTSAIAQAAAGAVTTPFTGNINAPTTVAGNQVVGSTTVAGQPGFLVKDAQGNITAVPQQALVDTSNTAAALQTFGIITGKAPTSDKFAALAAMGVKAGVANNIITQVEGGNALAALQIFQTAKNFDQMNPLQKAVAAIQTSSSVLHLANGINQSISGTSAAASQLAYASSGAASAAQYAGTAGQVIAAGYTAYETGKAVLGANKASASQRTKADATAVGNAVTGINGIPGGAQVVKEMTKNPTTAAIGAMTAGTLALPFLGGAALSAFGTGKDTGQLMRDGYRKGLKDAGIINVDKDGAYNVKLADGSGYDIGKDGGAKLTNLGTNIDGKTERATTDIDWSNPTAVASIPDAHLFAIATGLDPTSGEKHGLFDRSVAQIVNAATSNTNDPNGVRDNLKSMLGDKVNPAQIAGRVELLRAQNNISDQEYGVYLDHINKMFGTEFSPTDKTQSAQQIVSALQSKGRLSGDEKSLLTSLTDPKQLSKNAEALNKRLGSAMDEVKPVTKDPNLMAPRPIMKDPNVIKVNSPIMRPTPRTNTGGVSDAVRQDIQRIRDSRAAWA